MMHLTGVGSPSATSVLLTIPPAAAVGVYPNMSALGGTGQLASVIGALMSIVLIMAVLMIVVCAAAWAICSSQGDFQGAGKARTGLLVALGAAALDGGGVAWMNFLLHIGTTL